MDPMSAPSSGEVVVTETNSIAAAGVLLTFET
jgi:hypothetical protein